MLLSELFIKSNTDITLKKLYLTHCILRKILLMSFVFNKKLLKIKCYLPQSVFKKI